MTEAAKILNRKRERVRMIAPEKEDKDLMVTLSAVESEYIVIRDEILALKDTEGKAETPNSDGGT